MKESEVTSGDLAGQRQRRVFVVGSDDVVDVVALVVDDPHLFGRHCKKKREKKDRNPFLNKPESNETMSFDWWSARFRLASIDLDIIRRPRPHALKIRRSRLERERPPIRRRPVFFWPLYFWFSSTAVPLNKRDGPIRLRNRENECRSFDWSPVMDVVSSSGRRGFRLLLHLSSFSDAIIKKSNVRNRRKKNGFES